MAPGGADSGPGSTRPGARRAPADAGRESRSRDSGPPCRGRARRTRGRASPRSARGPRPPRRGHAPPPWAGPPSGENLFEALDGAPPLEGAANDLRPGGGGPGAQRGTRGDPLELRGQVSAVAAPPHERRLPVARVVAATAVVVSDERSATGHG